MRTISLLLALAVVACVSGIVTNHRSCSPPPPKPPRWDKKMTFTAARGTEPGKHGFEVTVEVAKGQVQEEAGPKQPAPPRQQEAAPVAKAVDEKPAVEDEAVPPADQGRSPARVVDLSDGKVIGWRITGEYQTSLEDATHKALLLAQVTVQRYLRSQEPPLQWVPPLNFVRTRLVKKLAGEQTDFGGSVGPMHRVVLDVKVTPEAWKEIVQQDREHRGEIVQQEREQQAKGRMLWLGKILAAIVVMLAALAGYIRLDDLTKGYLTHWLRLGVVFVGALAALSLILLG